MCNECYGVYDCPMCSDEPEMCKCDECDGTGIIYVTAEKGEVPYEEWLKAPESERDIDTCEVCEGTGKLII